MTPLQDRRQKRSQRQEQDERSPAARWRAKTTWCRRATVPGLIGLLLVLAGTTPAAGIELLDVPLDHWSYEFLERFEVRAGLDRTMLETRPLTRADMADLVQRLFEGAENGTWQPSAVERAQLVMLQREFSEELRRRGHDTPLLRRAYHQWHRQGNRVQVFLVARQQVDQSLLDRTGSLPQLDTSLLLQPAAAFEAAHHFAGFGQLNYRVRSTDGVLQQTTTTPEGATEFVFEPGDRFSITRTFDPYVRYGRGPVLVDVGRERLRWGPGRSNNVLLADGHPPLDQLRLRLDFGPVWFTSVFAQVRPERLRSDDPPLVEKYVALHRLVVQPHQRLVLGFSDAVAYGDRGIDLSYLNPLALFFITQANNGDRDNALTGVDFKLLLPDLEIYGELLLDDLNLRRGVQDYGNKPAVVAGLLWMQPLGVADWDVDLEWSWAAQYTYTHVVPINRWEHYGETLGSRAGTDAALLVTGLRRRWSRGWSTRAFYELESQGEGDVSISHDERSDDDQAFLSGTVERLHRPGLEVRYQGLRDLVLDSRLSWVIVENPAHDDSRNALESLLFHLQARVEF